MPHRSIKPKSFRITYYFVVVICIFIVIQFIFIHFHGHESMNTASIKNFILGSLRGSPFTSLPPLPAHEINENLTLSLDEVSLPAIALDYSEVVLSSIIERAPANSLYITLFLLAHNIVLDRIDYRLVGMNTEMKTSHWDKLTENFRNSRYLENGIRDTSYAPYTCKLFIPEIGFSQIVPASFLPNKQTVDSNSNRLLDVLRCPLHLSPAAVTYLHSSPADVHIELAIRSFSVLHYSIPWETRRTGYLLSSSSNSSHFKPWEDASDIHVCTSGLRREASQESVAQFAEFVQHHINIGAGHVFISAGFTRSSYRMRRLVHLLSPFIASGHLTITSQSEDTDYLSSALGLMFHRLMVKNIFANMCLYLSKGSAEYAIMLDLDEFFIPKSPHSSFREVLRIANSPLPLHPSNTTGTIESWRPAPGWSDGDGHPFCYLQVPTEVVESGLGYKNNFWFGSLFNEPPINGTSADANPIPIFPTARIYQAGLYVGGGCQLDVSFTPCSTLRDGLCISNFTKPGEWVRYQFDTVKPSVPAKQYLDDIVHARDIKQLDRRRDASVYHFSMHHQRRNQVSLASNDYLRRFHAQNVQDLKSKGFESILSLPSVSETVRDEQPIIAGWLSVEKPVDVTPIQPVKQADFKYEYAPSHNMSAATLPAFTSDFTDAVLASLIEREHESFNLHVTVFFLSHSLLTEPPKGYGVSKIRPDALDNWKRAIIGFEQLKVNKENGLRMNSKLECRIRNTNSSEAYIVPGNFMPNALTPDANANKRTDIMRCAMKDTKHAYQHLIRSDESVVVEILNAGVPILQYSIPWATRRTGFTLDSAPTASKYDPWNGYDSSEPDTPPGAKGSDDLYMCVPGMESPMYRKDFFLFVEFIQHHMLLGVQHMFLSTTYSWNGGNMARLIGALQSYINEGRLTITSQAGDNIDLLYSFLGLSVDRDNVKIMNVNMCLYLAKGSAEYLAIWDFDEYFIPKPPYKSIMDVVRAVDAPITSLTPMTVNTDMAIAKSNWKPSRGMADMDGHPLCYILLSSEVVYTSKVDQKLDPLEPWLGINFDHAPEKVGTKEGLAFKKSIIPTRRIFQAGLHMHGGCKLPPPWSGCSHDDFCQGTHPRHFYGLSPLPNGAYVDFSNEQRFDGLLLDKDAKRIDRVTEAVIYHFQVHRQHLGASDDAINGTRNAYAVDYFPRVMAEMKRRGVDLFATMPYALPTPADINSDWLNAYEVSQSVDATPLTSMQRSEKLPISSLPAFAGDRSEVFLASLIEREFDSFDLHLTTFLMCHEVAANKTGKIQGSSIRPDAVKDWKRFIARAKATTYDNFGVRNAQQESFHCKIKNTASSREYTAVGRFIPHDTTPDANANKRLDILRCKLEDAEEAYRSLIHTGEEVSVEIYRNGDQLIHFTIPWMKRRVGYTLDSPTEATGFNPWQGVSEYDSPGSSGTHELYMAVPGVESPLAKNTLPMYVEFIQHHLLLGVQHMFLSASYAWGSWNMDRLVGALRTYIDEGSITVTSQAGDNLDYTYSVLGLSLDRDIVKVWNVNMCLYLSKGSAEYMAVWDVDEYFIPKPPYRTILDLLHAHDAPPHALSLPSHSSVGDLLSRWQGGAGWADADGHPLCYFLLNSEVLLSTGANIPSPWIGTRFSHGVEPNKVGLEFKKSIIPTRKIFYAGLHMHGACRLPPPWSGCNSTMEFCPVSVFPHHRYGWTMHNQSFVDFSVTHHFDGLLLDKDAKRLHPQNESVIYHYQFHRPYLTASPITRQKTNDYTAKHFHKVLQQLRLRGLEALVTMPDTWEYTYRPDNSWSQFGSIYSAVTNKPHPHNKKLRG